MKAKPQAVTAVDDAALRREARRVLMDALKADMSFTSAAANLALQILNLPLFMEKE